MNVYTYNEADKIYHQQPVGNEYNYKTALKVAINNTRTTRGGEKKISVCLRHSHISQTISFVIIFSSVSVDPKRINVKVIRPAKKTKNAY